MDMVNKEISVRGDRKINSPCLDHFKAGLMQLTPVPFTNTNAKKTASCDERCSPTRYTNPKGPKRVWSIEKAALVTNQEPNRF